MEKSFRSTKQMATLYYTIAEDDVVITTFCNDTPVPQSFCSDDLRELAEHLQKLADQLDSKSKPALELRVQRLEDTVKRLIKSSGLNEVVAGG